MKTILCLVVLLAGCAPRPMPTWHQLVGQPQGIGECDFHYHKSRVHYHYILITKDECQQQFEWETR